MNSAEFLKAVTEISGALIKRNRDKCWQKAQEELLECISRFDDFLNAISKSRLEIRMTHENGDKVFNQLIVHLHDKKVNKTVIKNMLNFLVPKNNEYPIAVLHGQQPVGLGDQAMIYHQVLGLFQHERTALVEYLAKCEEIT